MIIKVSFTSSETSTDKLVEFAPYHISNILNKYSFPCKLILEIQGRGTARKKNFVIDEYFESQILCIIHLSALLILIEKLKLRIFSLEYRPIFDVSFENGFMLFSRAGFSSIQERENIISNLVSVIEFIYEQSDSDLKLFRSDIKNAAILLAQDLTTFGH